MKNGKLGGLRGVLAERTEKKRNTDEVVRKKKGLLIAEETSEATPVRKKLGEKGGLMFQDLVWGKNLASGGKGEITCDFARKKHPKILQRFPPRGKRGLGGEGGRGTSH